MLCAIAYVVVAVGRVPLILFLKYDPKDVVIAIGGLIFGPLASLAISVIVSFVEMITISENGILGFIMNVLSSCTFACTAAFIYKRWHKLSGAVVWAGRWLGAHGGRDAALELSDCADLYGVSERGRGQAAASCIPSL